MKPLCVRWRRCQDVQVGDVDDRVTRPNSYQRRSGASLLKWLLPSAPVYAIKVRQS